MAAVTICSDFGAPQNKVWHYFHCFPIYFPWSDGTRCHDLRFLSAELKSYNEGNFFFFDQSVFWALICASDWNWKCFSVIIVDSVLLNILFK